MPEDSCAAIILAAGASTRLKIPKQLLRIEGESLLRRTVRLALGARCAPVIAVLGYEAEKMMPELAELDVHCVVHPEWQAGMGSSLRCGMQAVLRHDKTAKNVMVLVCDQVRLTSKLLSQLRESHRSAKSPLTAARYAGRLGSPAIFSYALFGELLALSGDKGARDLIERQGSQVVSIDFAEGVDDVDTPQDMARLLL